MIKKISVLSLAAAAIALASVGCAQPQNTAQNTTQRKVYYHDRSTSVGSNVPRSYSDPASANSQTATTGPDEMQADQMQRFGSAVGNTGSAGR